MENLAEPISQGQNDMAIRVGRGLWQLAKDHGRRTFSVHHSSLIVHRFFVALAVLALSFSIRSTPLLAQGETVYGIVAS
ncbi:MAG TPA: hypothetical protein VKM93_07970, partial [Terriglobia bacterium]|nr:hypothetical protein [Terriglobia bacterium]